METLKFASSHLDKLLYFAHGTYKSTNAGKMNSYFGNPSNSPIF